MNMNWLNFKRIGIFGIISFLFMALHAEECENRFWNSLKPEYAKLQYAGGMGLFSVGIGWEYGKNQQWETDLSIGYVPKYSSERAKTTMTFKQNFIPWRTSIGKNLQLEPLECGLYVNTIFGKEFWTKEPSHYPDSYYGFSSRIRFHLFVGQRLKYDLPEQLRFLGKSVTAFYEISSCDLYIVSAFVNHLNPDDYLRLSLGLKFNIF